MKKIVIIGAGGFGREVAWLIERIKKYEIIGFIDDKISVGEKVGSYYVIGNTNDLLTFEECKVAIGVGSSNARNRIFNKISVNKNLEFPNLIDPSVIRGEQKEIGIGNIIFAGCILSIEYELGNFNVLYFDCIVCHSSKLKNFVTLLPSVNVSGDVIIHDNTEVGVGTQIIQGIEILDHVIIGAGSVIIRNTDRNVTIVGTPGKVIKYHQNII